MLSTPRCGWARTLQGGVWGSEASRLTFIALARRVVEGESQGDDGRNFQDDQSHILQRFPHELQEGFWLLWRYEVLPKNLFSLFKVWSGAWQTCGQSAERLAWRVHVPRIVSSGAGHMAKSREREEIEQGTCRHQPGAQNGHLGNARDTSSGVNSGLPK